MLLMMMFNLVQADPLSGDDTSEFKTWTYKETPMGLYIPKPTGNPLPVVMFLHGCNNNPVCPDLWIISALNAIEPCAVFLPTAPPTLNTPYPCADWGGTYDSGLRPQMINALHELDSLIDHYGFDPQRQYLYGESMGGEGVYRLLMDFPTRFAGAVNAAGYTLNKGAAQMAKTALWILIGSDDEMSPVDNSRAIYNSILRPRPCTGNRTGSRRTGSAGVVAYSETFDRYYSKVREENKHLPPHPSVLIHGWKPVFFFPVSCWNHRHIIRPQRTNNFQDRYAEKIV
jgi:predicted esterase